jgi:GTP-binding protein EngB required for normal cell division
MDDRSMVQPKQSQAPTLWELIAEALEVPVADSEAAETARSRLNQLADRLTSQKLNLAVLGQFKRGKSTLLNALLGSPILPVAVTPLTAIPTFIGAGASFQLRTTTISGEVEDIPAANADALHSLLQARVTEAENPHNRLGLARVDVTAPSALLERGVTLIDTPGVGSTYQHNTDTAEAVLPECDAALFVVSPDPPITATELDYLARIRATAPRIILVLNKIDVIDPEDRQPAIEFLREVAADKAGLEDAPLFCVSARAGLRAKLAQDSDALRASGMPRLEDYLLHFLAEEKSQTLEQAAARKASALVGELRFGAETALAVLRMPIDQLSAQLASFDKAVVRFEAERTVASDLIAGDRKRILAALDADAEELHDTLLRSLGAGLAPDLDAGKSEDAIISNLSERLPVVFQAEFERLEAKTRARFTETLGVHQARAQDLILEVRRTAANLLAIRYAAPAPEETFVLKKVPFWVTTARDTLHLVPPGAIDAFLPAALRRRRIAQRYRALLNEVVARNVENLRWALRQNLEAGFRDFESRLDEQLRLTLYATREAFQRGLQRRGETLSATDSEVQALQQAVARLSEIGAVLSSLDS